MINAQAIAAKLAALPLPDGPLVAALPMYDWPERRDEVDAEWAVLRDALQARGIDAPEELSRCNADLPPVPGGIRNAAGKVIAPDPATLPAKEFNFEALWQHPKLLFAQTCWGPLELWLGGAVQVIGQDDYTGIEGGQGELYSSAIVMRRSSTPLTKSEIVWMLSGQRLAYNVTDSMSGYIALERMLKEQGADLDIFVDRIASGGHRKSIRMVAEGLADVAAIDCRSWQLALKHEPAAKELAVVGWTPLRKGLPFITARR
jgi:ABC-type phosphate/phosphonate transport system substrate-binding protein